MSTSFSKTAFCCWFFCVFFLVACLISAEQLPKSLHSTGNGFGPRQAGVVFELATENEISVCYLTALCTSHSPPPPPSSLPCLSSHGGVNLSLMDDIQNQVLSLPSDMNDRQIMTAAQEVASILKWLTKAISHPRK